MTRLVARPDRRPPLGGVGWPQVAAVALAVIGLIQLAAQTGSAAHFTSSMLILMLVATLPLALLPAQPIVAATAVTIAILFALADPGRPTIAAVAAAMIAMYAAGRTRSRRVTALLLVPLLGAPFWLSGSARAWAIAVAGLSVAAAGAGAVFRSRRRSAHRDASVRAMQGALVEHVARGERARIARELHDVVAHHVSLIAVQAEAAQYTQGSSAQFATIADNARTALAEMRRLLGVLREDADAEHDVREPQPGLRQLVALVDRARPAQGGGVRLLLRGNVRPLDAGVELIAFRIVQEALTNTRRHAPSAAVDVDLTYALDCLHIQVRDNGPGPPPDAVAGHGLAGMRERAAMLGGQLLSGAAPAGGYVIDARLPL